MSIQITLNHHKSYQFERPIFLGPHVIRLRPSPHYPLPIQSYTLKISPEDHSLSWRQDVYGNWLAKVNFPNPIQHFKIEVELLINLYPINPFQFLIDPDAVEYPFIYEDLLKQELNSFFEIKESGELLQQYLETLDTTRQFTTNFITAINQKIAQDIEYQMRLEEGIQSCEETLTKRTGSCRDSAWLLVQIFRHLGIASRFVSGYLIQLAIDETPLDDSITITKDMADLHAWVEVFLPGAGWIGLDPTSGMLTAEGHIALAVGSHPDMASPIVGTIEPCETTLDFSLTVSRIYETPKVSKPYHHQQWLEINHLGQFVDQQLLENQIGLTMGGEPTFISIDDFESPEWRFEAEGETKRQKAGILLRKLSDQFAFGGILQETIGKWYSGESLPRWALGCFWRLDQIPVCRFPELWEDESKNNHYSLEQAQFFINTLTQYLRVDPACILPAYSGKNQPPNGYILPLLWGIKEQQECWISCLWETETPIYLEEGESSIGLRLPLNRINWNPQLEWEPPPNPERKNTPLGDFVNRVKDRHQQPIYLTSINSIKVALTVEIKNGNLEIFIPPIGILESYLDLITCIENTAKELQLSINLKGYPPPADPRLQRFFITPDPGVIEVNIHPAKTWNELVKITEILYEQARLSRLGVEKYTLEGRTISTGGGCHVTIGGMTPLESPLLRRPDLLKSLITFWQNHPSLSYLFAGEFVGATSQSPRIDEARHDTLYELEIAFKQFDKYDFLPPEILDQLLRNLLIDITGNTHRSAFCIDKLYPVNFPENQLGLLEFRSFAMLPHPQMSLVINLLIRALVAQFWQHPYDKKLVRWGTQLHDRFFLPYYIGEDLKDVILFLQQRGYPFQFDWFLPFFEFRFPSYGSMIKEGVKLELHYALESWPVLAEEMTHRGTSRSVDDSMERLQITLNNGIEDRYFVTCNGYPVPLHSTTIHGQFVAGVRYRARQSTPSLHPAIAPHVPLIFDIIDTWKERSIGGCMLYNSDPSGAIWQTFPINEREAQGRLKSRFIPQGHTPNPIKISPLSPSQEFPLTLDLRSYF